MTLTVRSAGPPNVYRQSSKAIPCSDTLSDSDGLRLMYSMG
jgi:hypothetical protein